MAHRGTIIAVSRCLTAEDFQNAFRRYAEPTALFIPTSKPFAAADTAYLHVCLSTGETLLEGEVEVRSAVDRVAGLYGRPGMTVRFVAPDGVNKEMLTQLVRARTMLKPVPLPAHLTARPALPSLNLTALAALAPTPPPSVSDAVLQLAECALVDTQGYELGAFAGSEFTSTKMTPVVPVEPRLSKASVAPTPPVAAASEAAAPWRGEGTQLVPLAPVAETVASPSQHVISAVNATPGTWAPDSTRTEVSPGAWDGDDEVAPPPAQATSAVSPPPEADDDDLEAVNTNVVTKTSLSQIMQAAKQTAKAGATPTPVDDTSTTGTVSTPAEGAPRADTSIPPPTGEAVPTDAGIIQTLKGVAAMPPRMRAESLAPEALEDDEEDDAGTQAFGGATNPRVSVPGPSLAATALASVPSVATVAPVGASAPATANAALRSYSGAQPLNVSEFHSARASVTIDAVMPTPDGRMHRASLAPGGVTLSSASLRGTALAPARRGPKLAIWVLAAAVLLAAAAFAVWHFMLRANDDAGASAPVTAAPPRPAAVPAPAPAPTPASAAAAANANAAAAQPTEAPPVMADAGAVDATTGDANGAVAANKPAPACQVAFTVQPPTATLAADGTKLGSARKVKSLPCDTREVTASAVQYADKIVKLKLKPGAKHVQKLQLARPQFEMTIHSKPAGAQVRINGKLAGKTPLTKAITGFEPQQLELRKPGYKPKRAKLVAKAPATLDYPLAKQ